MGVRRLADSVGASTAQPVAAHPWAGSMDELLAGHGRAGNIPAVKVLSQHGQISTAVQPRGPVLLPVVHYLSHTSSICHSHCIGDRLNTVSYYSWPKSSVSRGLDQAH